MLALPKVNVVPLATGRGDCNNWPNRISSKAAFLTGALALTIRSDNADTDGLELRAFKFFNGSFRNGSIAWNMNQLVADMKRTNDSQRPAFRCYNSRLLNQYRNVDDLRVELNFYPDPRHATLSNNTGLKPTIYAHEIDGVRQPGVYLGWNNQTTWGLSRVHQKPDHEIRWVAASLQGVPSDINSIDVPRAESWPKPEFYGFVEVIPIPFTAN